MQILIQKVWEGTRASAFLARSQVMPTHRVAQALLHLRTQYITEEILHLPRVHEFSFSSISIIILMKTYIL